ncbi:E3 ubiquitin-protein ligase SspH1 [Pandoraea anhela]|uniref:E3 ubiquitin-protein ligase SspH1 n=2 Tax=Pandoraea anhela TaxID=2508295 RepID=A0A5E4U732_9BURK|nr:E3 ubiquitin-protein ligase SspH1 [Pandoraea anhela]
MVASASQRGQCSNADPTQRLRDSLHRQRLLRTQSLRQAQTLVEAGAFDDEIAASRYLLKFNFPNDEYGRHARASLVQQRSLTGRTPFEFCRYLHSPIDIGDSAAQMLVGARAFITQKDARQYLAKFGQIDGISRNDLANELRCIALTRILEGRSPTWAFESVAPADVLALYGPSSIPHHIENLDVVADKRRELILPHAMPQLTTLRIDGDIALKLPVDVPKLTRVSLNGVRLPRMFRVPVIPVATSLSIIGSSAESIHIPHECRSLVTLEISRNLQLRIVTLEALPQHIRDSDASALAHVEITNNPVLRQIELPPSLPSATSLVLADNDLTASPLTRIRHLKNVRTIRLGRNRLSTLAALPDMPRLHLMDLAHNQFTYIPSSIASLRGVPAEIDVSQPGPDASSGASMRWADVVMIGNPIDAQAIGHWKQRSIAPTGARAYFSMAPRVTPRVRPIIDAVSDWYPPLSPLRHSESWRTLSGHADASDFSAFLDSLRRTVFYESEAFRSGFSAWLTRLRTDCALRDDVLPQSRGSSTASDEDVTSIYRTMQHETLTYEVARGDYDARPDTLGVVMRGLFDLDVLERLVRNLTVTMPHLVKTEGYLALQVKLREMLSLHVDTTDMRDFEVPGIAGATLSHAYHHVIRQRESEFPTFLARSPAVQQAIKRRWPGEFEAAQQRLAHGSAPDVFGALVARRFARH